MIVNCQPSTAPEVTDVEDLTRLHVTISPGGSLEPVGEIEGEHAWLDIETLRRSGRATNNPAEWEDRFSGMIEYAASKGWVDRSRGAVRAHIVRLDP